MTQPPEGSGIVSDNPWSSLQVPSEGSAEEAGGPASMDTQEAPKPTADIEAQTADQKADEPMPGTAEDRVADEREKNPNGLSPMLNRMSLLHHRVWYPLIWKRSRIMLVRHMKL